MMTSGSTHGKEKAASLGPAVPVGSPMLLISTPACNWRRPLALPPAGLARAPRVSVGVVTAGVVFAGVVAVVPGVVAAGVVFAGVVAAGVVFAGVVVATEVVVSVFLQPIRTRLNIKIIAKVINIILFILSFHSFR